MEFVVKLEENLPLCLTLSETQFPTYYITFLVFHKDANFGIQNTENCKKVC